MQGVLPLVNIVIVGLCQGLGMLVISIGVVKALWIFLKDVVTPGRSVKAVQRSRLELGHSFSLALGFLIGGSILKTAVEPDWSEIGQLAAIIAIRTVLNYLLLREIASQSASRTKPPGVLASFLGVRAQPDEAGGAQSAPPAA